MARPKKDALITKDSKASLSNILNEMCYDEHMTLQEIRFFLVYLSKINPLRPNEIVVTFPLEEYADLLGVELNEKKIMSVTKKLLRYVVSVRPKVLQPGIRQHIMNRQLFSKSDLYQQEDGKWFLTFACHDDIKEYLFDLKSEFTSIQMWNVVNLSSFQDVRMYMLLCQYRTMGKRTIDIDELKKMLCIKQDSYQEYKIFSRDILKKSQKALKERTDIEFDFRAIGRPAKAVEFTIRSNRDYTLPRFLTDEKQVQAEEMEQFRIEDIPDPEDPLVMAITVLPDDFDREQVQRLFSLAEKHVPSEVMGFYDKQMWVSDYLQEKVQLMKVQKKKVAKRSRFSWLCKAADQDWRA